MTTIVDSTEDDPLYAEGRYFATDAPAPAGYRLPVPRGNYRVTLHFSELFYASRGQRVFYVLIEGRAVIEKYDMVESSGFSSADVRRFETDVRDGILDITFRHFVENPRIAGRRGGGGMPGAPPDRRLKGCRRPAHRTTGSILTPPRRTRNR